MSQTLSPVLARAVWAGASLVPAGGAGGAPSGGPAAGPPYFKKENVVLTSPVERGRAPRLTGRVKLKRCGCGDVWCSACGQKRGLQVRDDIREEFKTFHQTYMLVVTVDPALFPEGPEFAYDWVTRTKGAIGKLKRELNRRRHLHSDRHITILEFQQNGWPHWHIVFDATFIPIWRARELWARYNWCQLRWGPMPRVEKGSRPVFGSVVYRVESKSRHALVSYLTVYLTKAPKAGWPQWVLDRDPSRRIQRFTPSKGFWRVTRPPAVKKEGFGLLRRRYLDGSETWEDAPELERVQRSAPRTSRQRHASCGEKTVVLREVEIRLPFTGNVETYWEWVGIVSDPMWSSAEDKRHDGGAFWDSACDRSKDGFVVFSEHDVGLVEMICPDVSKGVAHAYQA